MTEIIPRLYIGSIREASNYIWLRNHGITHIVNVANGVKDYFPIRFRYLHLHLGDNLTQQLFPYLITAYEYIDRALSNPNNRVLVHCAAGISRSSSTIIYYLMKKYGMNFQKAYAYTKSRHPRTSPNVNFRIQLKNVYRNVHGDPINIALNKVVREMFWR